MLETEKIEFVKLFKEDFLPKVNEFRAEVLSKGKEFSFISEINKLNDEELGERILDEYFNFVDNMHKFAGGRYEEYIAKRPQVLVYKVNKAELDSEVESVVSKAIFEVERDCSNICGDIPLNYIDCIKDANGNILALLEADLSLVDVEDKLVKRDMEKVSFVEDYTITNLENNGIFGKELYSFINWNPNNVMQSIFNKYIITTGNCPCCSDKFFEKNKDV